MQSQEELNKFPFPTCIIYLLLCDKLPQNLVA